MRHPPPTPTPADLSLVQIIQRFSTGEAARKYLEAVRWPDGPVCPHCGNCRSDRVYRIEPNEAKRVRPGLYQCAECAKQFTVTVGTIFEKTQVPLHKWVIAFYLLCASKMGFPALQLMRVLDIGSYRTAWFMFHRIRYALKNGGFEGKLNGVVEADETYVGGKVPGKRGRGAMGKTIVFSAVQRDGEFRSEVVKNVSGETLGQALARNVEKSANIMTDDWPSYRPAARSFASHEVINHMRREYVRGEVHTNTAESFFSWLKRSYFGVYRHWAPKYTPQYVGEFSYRWNTRRETDGARTSRGMGLTDGKRITLRNLKACSTAA